MIKEDYVSFETAKLLKEKGFEGQCLSKYNSNGCIWDNIRYDGMLLGNNDIFPQEYLAPTLQMALKWLREVHSIAINIGWGEVLEETYRWWCIVLNMKNGEILRDSSYHQTYEEAANAAILYILGNLM